MTRNLGYFSLTGPASRIIFLHVLLMRFLESFNNTISYIGTAQMLKVSEVMKEMLEEHQGLNCKAEGPFTVAFNGLDMRE